MPTPTSYVYTISTDIPSGLVSVARLRQEIELSSIVTMIDFVAGGINSPGDDSLTLWFKDPLTSGEKTTLDGLSSQTPNSPASGGSILGDHSGLALPDDPQNVNVSGGSVAITSGNITVDSGTIDANGKILSPNDVDYLGDAANPLRVDPTGTTTQPVSAASLPLPSGAATETTLALVKAKTDNLDVLLSTRAAEHTAAASPHAARLSDGSAFYKATTPADTQPISAASLPLPTGAATETTLAALNVNAADIETILTAIRDTAGVKKITDALPAGTNNIGDVDVVSSALPTGAATETTLSSINTKTLAAGQAVMAASSPVVLASDQWPDTIARSTFHRITDGTTGPVAVMPASTIPSVTDKALVVVLSPNQVAIPVTTASNTAVTGDVFGRVLVGSSNTATVVRATAYTEQTVNFTGSIRSASVNDTAGGTGARSARITYYTQVGVGPLTEDVILNGTTAVNLVQSNRCYIEKIEVLAVGSLGANAGVITLFTGAAGAGTAVGTIGVGNAGAAVGDRQTFWAHHYVAAGKSASLYQLGAGTNGNQVGIAFLRAQSLLLANSMDVQITDFIPFLTNGGYSTRTLANAVHVDGFSRISAYVISNGTNTNFFANFDYSEE